MTFTLSIVLAAQTNMLALSRCPVPLVMVSPLLEATQIIQAQKSRSCSFSSNYTLKTRNFPPPCTGQWLKFPLRRYRQLWSQLTLHKSILCCKVKSPTIMDSKLLIVVPYSLQKLFLKLAHDNSGPRGVNCTMSKLSDMAYWIGMGRKVADHCKFCVKC